MKSMKNATPLHATIPGSLNLFLLFLGASVLVSLLFFSSHLPSAWLLLPMAAGFALVAGMLFSLLHEATHGVFHRNATLNAAGGIIAAAFFPTSYTLQKISHLGHHARNRTDVERFDLYKQNESVWLKYVQWYGVLTGLYWFLAPLSCLLMLVAPGLLRWKLLRSSDSPWAQQTSADAMIAPLLGPDLKWIRLQSLGVLLFHAALIYALRIELHVWLLFFFTFGFAWSSLQYATHAWSPVDVRTGAWNLRVFPPIRWMALNYHHHLAHHLHPSVPWNRLGGLIDPSDPRPSFLQIYLSMWKGPRPIEMGPELHDREVKKARASEKRWKAARGVGGISIAFFLLFYLVYSLTDWLSGYYVKRWNFSFGFEQSIPFVPAMAAVYLSLNGLFLLLPLRFRSAKRLFPVALSLSAELLLAAPFFLLIPLQNNFHHATPAGPTGFLYMLADGANLRFNDFPSLHVAFAWTSAWILAEHKGTSVRLLLNLWALLITASTILIHAHHLIDLPAGFVLGLFGMYLYRSRFRRLAYRRSWFIEWICFKENLRFIRRSKRYVSVFVGLLLISLPRWNERRTLRAGYSLIQHIDDVYDGDRPVTDPERHVGNLFANRPSLQHTMDAYAVEMRLLARYVLQRLAAKSTQHDDLTRKFRRLVDVMHLDYLRRCQSAVFKEFDLIEHHRQTFALSIDVTLALFGSRLRSQQVPEMVDALSWVSPTRDLQEDLANGIVNIPLHVLETAFPHETKKKRPLVFRDKLKAWALDGLRGRDIMADPQILGWVRLEHGKIGELLHSLPVKLQRFKQDSAGKYLFMFYYAIAHFHRSYGKVLAQGQV